MVVESTGYIQHVIRAIYIYTHAHKMSIYPYNQKKSEALAKRSVYNADAVHVVTATRPGLLHAYLVLVTLLIGWLFRFDNAAREHLRVSRRGRLVSPVCSKLT